MKRVRAPVGARIFSSPRRPDRLWGPPDFLYNGYGVNRPGREADHSLPTSAEIKNTWIYIVSPPYAFMTYCLIKQRDNFIVKVALPVFNELSTTPRRHVGGHGGTPSIGASPDAADKRKILPLPEIKPQSSILQPAPTPNNVLKFYSTYSSLRSSRVQFPIGARHLSVLHSVQDRLWGLPILLSGLLPPG
jgi:hypothetical protein